ncbi:MAG TPA: extracellular solute-binding protein [Ornithinimicrobium sp.]|uniref:extracellular solute-binding protein n=1 Tax=Ornithinimicrobium sp. TaxID=1977084 RepID=UPI002B4A1FF3|nr:extracellular solute-binding protein [Ornithinimicrobium sp.]HKJ12983.1 extracellular solute-binding protein [Ornithinimicrobium sp.]
MIRPWRAIGSVRRRPPRPTRVWAALGALSALLLTGCVGGDDEVVRVYSARHYDLEDAFIKFNEETGIKVEFLFGSDSELRERIAAEGEDTQADVYMTVDAGNLASAAEQGVFAPLESSVLDEAVPEGLRDPRDRWFGLAERARTIVYSPERVDTAQLSTYEALADPRWQGRLCLRQSSATYTQSLVASMIAERGEEGTEEVVQGWADNAEIFSNDVEIIDNIASGSCDVGIVNHYYLARELDEDPDLPVELFWANQDTTGTHVNISGAGVTAEADDPELAQRLLEWLATDGQSEFVADNDEYPVNDDVEPVPVIADFGDFTAQDIDAVAYAELNEAAIELMARAGYE